MRWASGPALVGDDIVEGFTGSGGGIFRGVPEGKEGYDSYLVRNAEYLLDLVFVEGADPTASYSLFACLEGHVVNGDSEVDRVALLTAGHDVVGFDGTGGDDDGSLCEELLVPCCGNELLFSFGVGDDDEFPLLHVPGGGCQPTGLEDESKFFVFDGLGLIFSYTAATGDGFSDVHCFTSLELGALRFFAVFDELFAHGLVL